MILTTLEEATEAFVKQAGVFSDRKIPPLLEKAFSNKGSVIWESGPSWRFHRRNIHSGLRQIELSDENLASKVILEITKLFMEIDKNLGTPTNLLESFMTLSARVVCSVTFGSRFSSFAEKDTFAEFLSSVKLISTKLTIFSAAMIFPPLYNTFIYKDVREAVDTMKSFLGDLLCDHRNMFEGKIRDVMDVYVDGMRKDSNKIQEESIWRTFFDLLGAGTDTTANTLSWCVMYMCAHPQYQEMIYNEMNDKCGNDDIVSMIHQTQLPLTNATLLEVMRCSTVVPLGVPRVTSSDTIFLGYKIPKGTDFWLNEYAIHHDRKLWQQPEEFRPERFLNAQKDSILPEKKNQLVSFGIGRRICIGKKLAEIELFLIFSNLFKRYNVRFAFPGQALDKVGIFGLTYSPKPFQVVLEKRQKDSLRL